MSREALNEFAGKQFGRRNKGFETIKNSVGTGKKKLSAFGGFR